MRVKRKYLIKGVHGEHVHPIDIELVDDLLGYRRLPARAAPAHAHQVGLVDDLPALVEPRRPTLRVHLPACRRLSTQLFTSRPSSIFLDYSNEPLEVVIK